MLHEAFNLYSHLLLFTYEHMYIHVYIRSGALVGVQYMCVWSVFV